MAIKNIILDVGRVLVTWDPEGAFQKLGCDKERAKAIVDATVHTPIWDETDRGVWSDEQFVTALCENAPQYEKEIRLFWDNIDLAIEQYPYTKEWLSSMKKQGFHIYILSNYGARTFELTKDKALNFLPLTDGAIFSYTIQQIKPDREIFETLLNRYQLQADECVFIDDRKENVEGAKKVGIHGICFRTIEQVKDDLKKYGVNV